MQKKILLLVLNFCLLMPCTLLSRDDDNHRLFHIERSKNKNIVCYDANINGSGTWDAAHPIAVYWINNEEHPGERSGLTFIQQNLAYGYKTISKGSNTFSITLNACNDRLIKITKGGNAYIVRTNINNREATLQVVYVKTQSNNSLKVEYIELRGIDVNGNSITERIYNK